MRRLLHVVSLTHDLERAKSFYRDAMGFTPTAEAPFMAGFARDGAGLVLVAVQPEQQLEAELCFEAPEIEETIRTLRQRGIEFADDLRTLEFGSVIHFRDPGGQLLSLLQPPASSAPALRSEPASAPTPGTPSEVESRPALTLVERAPREPLRFIAAAIGGTDPLALRDFYRDRLGLLVADDTPGWIRFETGSVSVVLRPHRSPKGAAVARSSVTFVFEVEDLDDWAVEARSRGVVMATPVDRGLGLESETVDPDGNALLLREPASQGSLEEKLAEPFEDDGAPQHAAMRKPIKKGAHAASRVAIRPEYKAETRKRGAEKKPRTQPETEPTSSIRDTDSVETRRSSKRQADPKRARARPATGRLKKAEARSVVTKKRSVASKSRTKPVKRAAAKVTRGRKPTRAK